MSVKPKARQVQQPEIGQLVRNLRVTMHLLQKKFADKFGMTFTTVNRWENGPATPSPLALKQFDVLLPPLSRSSDATLRTQIQAIRNKYGLAREPNA